MNIKLVSESAGANSNTISLMVVLLLTTLCSIGAQPITAPIEVKALLLVKQNLKGPRNFLKQWNKQTDPCTSNWTGVSCFNSPSPVDGYLHGQELQLMRMNLIGTLSPELGRFSYLEIMDFMWNNITGSIPKEIGNVKSLKLILLNGNKLTGSLPEELGDLSNLDRIQIDENFILGPLPISFANLTKAKHFHMNNNSISGSIPPQLSRLPSLVHFQLDNNHFDGGVPDSYSNMTKLLKMSLRNCSLTGPVPDMSRIPNLAYIDLSNNRLEGNIPDSFSGLPRLQRLSLGNNFLNGTLSSIIWSNRTMQPKNSSCNTCNIKTQDFQNNSLSDISSIISPPENVTIRLRGNPRWYAHEVLFWSHTVMRMMHKWNNASKDICKGALAGIILGVIAGAVTSTALVSIFIPRRYMKNYYRVMSKKHQLSKRISIKVDGVKGFTFEEMALATYNFDSSTQVGQGGYGKVYKGVLSDGSFVAIKRAQEGSFQGDKEFYNEIELLSRVHHRNLVSLIGCCDEKGEQMLVYEFMSGGTLRDHLSATDSAKGILYLHTEADPPIFHCDVKSSNILIGPRFRAKVADFGLSRLAPVPDIEGKTPGHVSTVVKGTPGYLDPEYFLTYKWTDKSDVYSLGVVFLEILTGGLPIQNGKNIVREVNGAYSSGTIFSIIDEKMGSYPSKCIQKFVTLALQCCQEDTDARPSMAHVVKELDNILYMMPESDISIAVSTDHDIDDSEVSMTITTTKTPPSSSSMSMSNMNWDLNVSSEYISSSNLVSGVVPTIAPR
ncbi:hypothetical protein C5167_024726 [Papaver somniferum]|uniref:Protein kinase domain-containing protein n=1 Tax=Papaver somniferum TaxID=3469 RepID=A0A4Y7JS90_PAPSO|nr:hypothetical protein C5167_024726 [Papaver somniferum]